MKANVRVGTPLECDEVELVVCALKAEFDPTMFPDNAEGTCCDCGRTVVFRPYAPKRPPRICMGCFADRCDGGHA